MNIILKISDIFPMRPMLSRQRRQPSRMNARQHKAKTQRASASGLQTGPQLVRKAA